MPGTESTPPPPAKADFVTLLRRLGAVALLLAAAAVWFGMAPDKPEVADHALQIAGIEANDDTNNVGTAGAPQQAVVNGWTTNEYLRLLAQQSDEVASASVSARDDRPAAMLGLCVVGLALVALTTKAASPGTGAVSRAPE